jgi:negative regulator of genetic competence, sporulation and motility
MKKIYGVVQSDKSDTEAHDARQDLKMIFGERGKSENPEKNLRSTKGNQQNFILLFKDSKVIILTCKASHLNNRFLP